MEIIIATPILYEKNSPFNHLFRDILEGLLNRGHSVTRVVAVEDTQNQDYEMGLTSESISYIPVVRKKAAHSNIITRYLLDSWTNLKMARKVWRLPKGDVLFEDVSYSSWLSVWAAKKRNLRVVAMLQDVWPDNAVQSGLMKENSILYRFFEFFQRYVYKNADRIVCISDDMKAFIASKGIPEEKISVIYNWGYTDEIVDIPWEENDFVQKYSLKKDVFYAVYAGNIGRMQNVELVVEAAKLLQQEENIHFLIIGDGARRNAIESLAEEYGLKNVTMLPFQPSELAVHIYRAAGVNIIPLVKNGVRSALPSKTGIVLSCGRPAVFAFGKNSRISTVLEETGAAGTVDSEDAHALVENILNLSGQTQVDSESVYGLFRRFFRRTANVERYVEEITGSY